MSSFSFPDPFVWRFIRFIDLLRKPLISPGHRCPHCQCQTVVSCSAPFKKVGEGGRGKPVLVAPSGLSRRDQQFSRVGRSSDVQMLEARCSPGSTGPPWQDPSSLSGGCPPPPSWYHSTWTQCGRLPAPHSHPSLLSPPLPGKPSCAFEAHAFEVLPPSPFLLPLTQMPRVTLSHSSDISAPVQTLSNTTPVLALGDFDTHRESLS